MSLAAAKIELANIFTPPPSFDWADVVAGDDLKKLEKGFDQYDRQAMQWRSTIVGQMQEGLKKLETGVSPLPKDEADKIVAAVVGDVLKALEESIATFSTPMHANPEMAGRVDQLSKLSNSAGRFVRKLLRRIEKVRVAQHSTCVDVYYGLLAFQSEHTDGRKDNRAFGDPEELDAFLRQHMAS
jgi:hypothetical protein